jgi:5-methyltetrahydrofolate--homocysteine methyltransferase
VPGGPSDRDYALSDIDRATRIPEPPFWGGRVVKGIPLRDIFPWVNQTALFRGQWQYQKGGRTDIEYAEFVEQSVQPVFRRMQDTAIAQQLLVPSVIYGYFPCVADQNDLIVWPDVQNGKPSGDPVRLEFPRQPGDRRLCIADFFLPQGVTGPNGEQFDVLGMSLVTMGERASEYAKQLFEANDYKDYLHWHGFSVECAEGLAEMIHRRVREELGIAVSDATDADGHLDHKRIFSQNYQGSRYSFGYPACPDLEQQVQMGALLAPSRIGVELSDTFQWHPEQTTSAVIAHHASARYFVVR